MRAPLYIHIYTSHFDTDALLHPLVVGGAGVLLAAAAASGGGICGGGDGGGGGGGGDVDGGSGGSGDAGGCAFFRECSPSALSDDRHITLAQNVHPSNSYIRYGSRLMLDFFYRYIAKRFFFRIFFKK